ncbi:MAG: class I SAM-dependent methyltransferase [Candidatus Bathyarchaeota archaeon]|nr:class I SAM-dependent methyltransferase [Candidatus Bathyarchaeota archaeon]
MTSNIGFRMMAFGFKIRDFLNPRQNSVKEVGLKPGFHVIDYGCGPGSYVLPVSEAIGSSGRLYALDINHLALEMVEKIAAKKKLKNVITIQSDCGTGLHDEELDVALLYDVFHDIADQNAVLNELQRVLKPNGVLSFSDHHLKENEIISKVTSTGLFKLQKINKYTYTFSKQTAKSSNWML